MMVPDIEGDAGYPQIPFLTNEEESAIRNWQTDTLKESLKHQMRNKSELRQLKTTEAREGCNQEIVTQFEHENEQKIHRETMRLEE